MPKLSPEGFLEAKASLKIEEQEAKKEQDLQKMSQLISADYFMDGDELVKIDVEGMEDAIISKIKTYFDKTIAYNTIPTIAGLAATLNVTRKQLKELQHKDTKIGTAVRKAFQAISAFAEEGLLSGKPPQGLVFWLKNNDDYVDSHEVKHDNKTIGEMMDELREKGEIINGN